MPELWIRNPGQWICTTPPREGGHMIVSFVDDDNETVGILDVESHSFEEFKAIWEEFCGTEGIFDFSDFLNLLYARGVDFKALDIEDMHTIKW